MDIKTIQNAGKAVLFTALALSLLMFFQGLMKPKWESDGLWEPVTSMVDGFFDEPENTMDVVYLGTSNAFYDINPLIIYDEYGLTGYVLGSGEQRLTCTYYYLQEIFKRQSPKVVVLECLGAYLTGPPGEEQSRKAYDYMPLSREKLVSIKETMGQEESLVSYIFPLVRYHGRIWDLGIRDFTYLFSDKHYPLKGYAYSDRVAANLPHLNMDLVLHEGIQIGQQNQEYLLKIRQLCEENEAQLLLVKTPNIEWGRYEHEGMLQLASQMKVEFVDYNMFYSELGITEQECFLDGAHLNDKGAKKLSLDLGGRVAALFWEEPEHNAKTMQEWEQDYSYYLSQFCNNSVTERFERKCEKR